MFVLKVCGFRVRGGKFLLKELVQKCRAGGLLVCSSVHACSHKAAEVISFMLTNTALLLSSTLPCLCPLSTILWVPGRPVHTSSWHHLKVEILAVTSHLFIPRVATLRQFFLSTFQFYMVKKILFNASPYTEYAWPNMATIYWHRWLYSCNSGILERAFVQLKPIKSMTAQIKSWNVYLYSSMYLHHSQTDK